MEPQVKSQSTVLVGYLVISTYVSCYQTRWRRQYYLPFSDTAHACTSAWCTQHSSTAAVQNSQLHFFWAMAPMGQSWTQLIKRFIESIAAWIWVAICNSTKLKKSSSGWLNTGKAVIQHFNEKMWFSCFCVLPGSAEALVRWGGKIKYWLTSYFLGNIFAKNY